MANKIRRNDKVIILSGKDKGKIGKVRSVFTSNKVIVGGVNLVKKHQKPAPNSNQSGSILEKEAEIDISNIAIFNESTKKADRVGFKIIDEKKVRFFKSNKEIIK